MLQEFKKFAMRGSVVDLAIGVIIGAAFGKIIDSMVNDILMPIIGRIFGGLDFTNYFIGLTPAASQAPTYDAAKKAGATLGYGSFITVTVNFVIIAWILFLVIKGMNRLFVQEQAAPPPPAPPTREQELLTEIAICSGRAVSCQPLGRRGVETSGERSEMRVSGRRHSGEAISLAPQQVFDRHRIGLGEQQRHERRKRRPGGARAGHVVGRGPLSTSTKPAV
jgi:large conductance mechanosensitive channel